MGIQDSAAEGTNNETVINIQGGDGVHKLDIISEGGVKKIPVIADIAATISNFGKDGKPDAFFTVTNAGVTGNTLQTKIKATSNDPTTPDRDTPAVDVTTTVTASEAGNEEALASLVVSDLNGDTNFQNALLKAGKVPNRAIVHLSSTVFSLPGEFYERPNAGDVEIITTGSVAIVLDSDKLLSRGKEIAQGRDPNNPHRQVTLTVAGSISVTSESISDQFSAKAKNTGSPNLLVDGTTPKEFKIVADADKDMFFELLTFGFLANGIKSNQFLSIATLTNGIDIEIRSDGKLITGFFADPIKTTDDLKFDFAMGLRSGYNLEFQAAADSISAVAIFNNPFPIRKAGTFSTDDEILIRVNDDLTAASLVRGEFFGFGFKKDV